MKIILGQSKAGHDKGRLYVILSEENDIYYLSDGKYRGVDNPKKKKTKHVQPIKRIPYEIEEFAKDINIPDDSDLRKIIKLYNLKR